MMVLDNGVSRAATATEEAEVNTRINAPQVASVPPAVTMLQARLALITAGHLKAMDDFITSMQGDDGDAARAYWEFAQRVVRDDPLVIRLAMHLNLSNVALDQLFIAASAL